MVKMMNALQRWVIFDADNTLWAIEPLYDEARARLCDYLSDFGISKQDTENYQHERDRQLHATYGYSACRFARSFEDTILHFISEAAATQVRHVRQIALDVFEKRAVLSPGLQELIDKLVPNYGLGIITAGERWVQERRLSDFHLRDRFSAIEIVESKDAAVFQRFIEKHGINGAISWVIGDSVNSDVLPARAAGLRAVLLSAANWDRVEGTVTALPADVPTISCLLEFLELKGVCVP
jgi:putative hydrolase of the HAD superfamily